jgi:hypothetical protein
MKVINYKLLLELPCELKREIRKFIQQEELYCCSKHDWKLYIKIKVNDVMFCNLGLIRYNTFNSYIRFIIRSKLNFVFKNIVQLSKIHFKRFKNFIYKGKKWTNYIEFLKWHCRNQESGKCLTEILEI